MGLLVSLVYFLLLAGCGCNDRAGGSYFTDGDGDGVADEYDCDDGDASVGAAQVYHPDYDHDGYGDPSEGVELCEPPDSYVTDATDCDDTDATIHPGAEELCDDPVDRNCDGSVGYADADADGWAACEDCDDADATVHPEAVETCDGRDEDCDGEVDEDVEGSAVWYADADADGFGDLASATTACSVPAGFVADATDCNDADAGVNPAAAEVCNGNDDDCNGLVDDGALDAATWYGDGDGDGWGDDARLAVECTQPTGYVAGGGDCDDADAAYHPGATELCTDNADYNCDGSVGYADADGDGFAACEECDDTNAANYPGATELCDDADNDCDGVVDESDAADASTWYADADADGYGNAASSVSACDPVTGYVADATDCDDALDTVNPGAVEACNGLDDDCDGTVDESDASDGSTWYTDADGDGYGDASTAVVACDAPAGATTGSGDCDDADAAYHPGATETCDDTEDYNCDGSVGYADADGDGFAACEECDDADATVNPGAAEACNGVDDDCDGTVDEDATGSTWYADLDGDGFGDALSTATGCTAPAGYVADSTDCDDLDGAVNPAGIEACNGIDDDCDGVVDEDDAIDATEWYADADGDGYGHPPSATYACTQPDDHVATGTDCDDSDAAYNPGATETCTDTEDYNCDGSVGYVDADGDGFAACEECNDADATVYPGATEWCDGADNDCDGSVDEDDAVDASTWYADADGDGYGDVSSTTTACNQPTGYLADATDCDDTHADVNPGATETCDGRDEDCDGTADEGAADATTWYADADGDGYGDDTSTTAACDEPVGYARFGGDCDDADAAYNPGATEACDDPNDYNCDGSVAYADADGDGFAACEECNDSDAAVNPSATEVCNGVDDDCDGTVDDGASDASTWYADVDTDGYGDPSSTTGACDRPVGYAANAADCDDADASINPGELESCNGVDDDCDGSVDEDAVDTSTWYVDADGDGYGDASSTTTACDAPAGYVTSATDCDDTDPAYNPGATEACDDPNDYNCDGSVAYADADGDGYAACVECDDADASVNPGATETCNDVDDDCDGEVDEDATDGTAWYTDGDGDGYGDATAEVVACDAPAGAVSDSTDCDDTDATVSPAGTETCNGIDDDCNGLVDDGTACTDCDVEYYGDDDVPYLFCWATRLSWLRSEAACDGYGYTLVTVDDEDENDWVTSTAYDYAASRWWIGLNDRDTEGTYAWSSGAAVSYTNWAPGQPLDPGGNADCVAFGRFSVATWSDETCSAARPYVCEGG